MFASRVFTREVSAFSAVVLLCLAACDGGEEESESAPVTQSETVQQPLSSTSQWQYFPLDSPIRLIDTRPGTSSLDARKTPLAAGTVFTFPGANVTFGGVTIPSTARALVGNVTVTKPVGAGNLTAFGGPVVPGTSTLNFVTNDTIPTAFTTVLGLDSTMSIVSTVQTDVMVDVIGFFAPAAPGGLFFRPLSQPVRLLDTRSGTAIAAGTSRAVSTTSALPATATALLGNLTVVNPTTGGTGFITTFATGAARPNVSMQNYTPGLTAANAFTVKLGSSSFSIFASTTTHVIVDVVGYYSADAVDSNGNGLVYCGLEKPFRLMDTRVGTRNFYRPNAPFGANTVSTRAVENLVVGRELIPTEAEALVGNVALINTTTSSGFFTLFPDAAVVPPTSNVNYGPNRTRANMFTTRTSSSGTLAMKASTSVNGIIDVLGYYRRAGTGRTIVTVPDREFVIRNLGTVEDTVRTRGTGVWTFSTLMGHLAGTQNKSTFTKNWLKTFLVNRTINGDVIPARPGIQTSVLGPWEVASGGATAALDFSKAPFRLLAIVNRMDLRSQGTIVNAGEGRFVFGVLDATGNPLPFTVIFEFKLPASTPDEVQAWAEAWHRLAAMGTGSAEFNAALEDVTAAFSRGGLVAGTFNGSALGQLRTNDIVGNTNVWQLREFFLSSTGVLTPTVIAQTPSGTLQFTTRLADFINQNEAAILSDTHKVPLNFGGAPFLGGAANVDFNWNAPGIFDPEARHKFSLATCQGCHSSETATQFTHISPRRAGQVAELSRFMTGIVVEDPIAGNLRQLNDLERRGTDFRALLLAGHEAGDPLGARVH